MTAIISAGDGLVASGIDPAAVRRALPAVEPFAVRIRVAPGWFRRLWAKGISAVALPWGVYVTEPVFARIREGAEPHRTGPLIVHELTHLQQYRRLGPVRHLAQYLADYLRGRRARRGHWEAYRAIRLEVEAREVAAHFVPDGAPQ